MANNLNKAARNVKHFKYSYNQVNHDTEISELEACQMTVHEILPCEITKQYSIIDYLIYIHTL